MSVRYAPSPTGIFHIGNLRTAWISNLFATTLGMPWVVRYEDIDQPRVVAGSRERQREDLEVLGLVADRESLQSEAAARHEALFRQAIQSGDVYPCSCSRREIQDELARMASAPNSAVSPEAPIYNGRCRKASDRPATQHSTLAWRFRNPLESAGHQDFIIGRTGRTGHSNPAGEDFVPGYHWACAIDDFDGRHALLVRASDLLHAIPSQRQIFEWVGRSSAEERPYPAVFHCSLVTSDDGHRLEKRTQGVTLEQLAERGTGIDRVLQAFKASFDPQTIAAYLPGKIWGESRAELKLGALGLQAPEL